MRNAYRIYITVFFVVLIAGLLLIGTLNVVVDPLEVWNTAWAAQHRDAKTANISRITKAQMLQRHPWETVLIGSSRVELGIKPLSPMFIDPYQPVYNAGLSGSNLEEVFIATRMAQTN